MHVFVMSMLPLIHPHPMSKSFNIMDRMSSLSTNFLLIA